MFDRIKIALGLGSKPAAGPPSTALVPIHRAEYPAQGAQMGALDGMADSSRPTLGTSMPPMRTFDLESRITHVPASAHARHLASVSGYLAHGIELMTAWMVGGDGLRLNLTPNASELGWTDDEARDFSVAAETLFREWADDAQTCDARGLRKFGALQQQAVRSWLLTGDVLAKLDYGPKRGARWRTAIDVLDPLRVRTPIYQQRVTVLDGIEVDARGRPVALHVLPVDGIGQTARVPFYSGNKRLVAHIFDGDAGAVRGVSPIAPAVGGLLQSMSAADAAVLAAHLNSLILATITSDLPSEAVMRQLGAGDDDPLSKLMGARIEWHEALKEKRADVRLGHNSRVVHLSTGERLDMHGSKNGFDDFDTILKHGLRELARALGISYESLTSDKGGATYSSLKYASVQERAIVDRRRKTLAEPFAEWALEAVLEEAVATGRLKFPQRGVYRRMSSLDAFRELKPHMLRAEWVGPAQSDPDEYKAARAAKLRMEMGISAPSDEIAATGKDPDATMDKIAADREAMRRRGYALPLHEPNRFKTSNQGGSK